ncbi:KpsF/GutQ family sugar-phosphate isomerase [Candidatus Pelagibacter sp.]|uniref:KpsF/GutQ family sugar-phosphate isomerase n=1 Tax=Candidatus Pelagibacter sp. TaxID=2024849 RepID=UPI003F85E858
MKNKSYRNIGKKVIELEIKALQNLKNSLSASFDIAVKEISKCKSKVILCGVGKSGLIASKISATLSSIGTPSFTLSAGDCSHGDLGSISKKDILILISYSGNTEELKNLIEYANRNEIKLIGIVSKKNSILYKNSNIKLFIPEVQESGYGIVPTSSTTSQLALGDAIAISLMQLKKFDKLDFKKFHPAGSLGKKLRTVEDCMLIKNKIPFINENYEMKKAINLMENKKLGVLIIRNSKLQTTGILTDGDIKRVLQKKINFGKIKIKNIMTKKPISIEKDSLAARALSIMNQKKITSLCVYKKPQKNKTIGIIHIHNLLESDIK